ncbi:MAG: DUF397 domain-containing protein [Pseudonocardiaceae bacterium]|nr:DUF397 domain-containing protein [Pseudonocardiaceae bacterium]
MSTANRAGNPPVGTAWRKSSYSGAGNDCVEVAMTSGGAVVRDSKNPRTELLSMSRRDWYALMGAARDGKLDY